MDGDVILIISLLDYILESRYEEKVYGLTVKHQSTSIKNFHIEEDFKRTDNRLRYPSLVDYGHKVIFVRELGKLKS